MAEESSSSSESRSSMVCDLPLAIRSSRALKSLQIVDVSFYNVKCSITFFDDLLVTFAVVQDLL